MKSLCSVVSEFGIPTVPVREIIQRISDWLADGDASVRLEATHLVVELNRWSESAGAIQPIIQKAKQVRFELQISFILAEE